jgi:uncharacterized integral membrane protein
MAYFDDIISNIIKYMKTTNIKTFNILLAIFIAVILFLSITQIVNAQYFGDCTYHAYKLCVGNVVYWFSSCQQQQDIFSVCTNNQVCQYGNCVITPIISTEPNISNYNPFYRTACYNNSIHWFDSLGSESGLYKSCIDKNSCTLDRCTASGCSNILKCDETTCAKETTDYNTYCAPQQPAETQPTENQPVETSQNTVTPTNTNNQIQDAVPVAASAAAVSEPVAKGLKTIKWYVWVVVGIILLFLFVAIFKKFSSEA